MNKRKPNEKNDKQTNKKAPAIEVMFISYCHEMRRASKGQGGCVAKIRVGLD
jgi:hypothetical protein